MIDKKLAVTIAWISSAVLVMAISFYGMFLISVWFFLAYGLWMVVGFARLVRKITSTSKLDCTGILDWCLIPGALPPLFVAAALTKVFKKLFPKDF